MSKINHLKWLILLEQKVLMPPKMLKGWIDLLEDKSYMCPVRAYDSKSIEDVRAYKRTVYYQLKSNLYAKGRNRMTRYQRKKLIRALKKIFKSM